MNLINYPVGLRNDPKVKKIRETFWRKGFGTYLAILEILAEKENQEFDLENIWNIAEENGFDLDIIEKLVEVELLQNREKKITSYFLENNLNQKNPSHVHDIGSIYTSKYIGNIEGIGSIQGIESIGSIKSIGSIENIKDKSLILQNWNFVNLKNPILEKFSEKKESYGKTEITELIENLKNYCEKNGISYDSEKERRFGNHIMKSKDFGKIAEIHNQSKIEFAINICKASIQINYWKWVCSGPKKIYQNYSEVYNLTKLKKYNNQSIPFIPDI